MKKAAQAAGSRLLRKIDELIDCKGILIAGGVTERELANVAKKNNGSWQG